MDRLATPPLKCLRVPSILYNVARVIFLREGARTDRGESNREKRKEVKEQHVQRVGGGVKSNQRERRRLS